MFRKEIKSFHFHIFFKKTKICFVKSVDLLFFLINGIGLNFM